MKALIAAAIIGAIMWYGATHPTDHTAPPAPLHVWTAGELEAQRMAREVEAQRRLLDQVRSRMTCRWKECAH